MSHSRVGSLGRRLSYWLAIQSLVGLAVVCAAVYGATYFGFQARQTEALVQKQTQVQHLLSEAGRDGDLALLKHKLDDFFIGHPDMALSLVRADGGAFYVRPLSDRAGVVRERQFVVPSPVANQGLLNAVLALNIRDDSALLSRIGLTLGVAAFTGAMLISAGGFALVRIGLRPLRELVQQTRKLAANTLHKRLDGSAQPEELEPLIKQFNALLARLQSAYEQLEGFNADVAHELCTPLATLIGSTEVALRRARDATELREVLGSNLEELRRLAGIVHDMLFLSQADRGAMARRGEKTSLAELARRIGDYHEAALSDAELTLDISGDALGSFDMPLVQRAVSNLIGNATRYADRSSTVRIEIIARTPGEVRLVVVNRGPTIAAEVLPRLFDRFFRADPSRSHADRNHGLGLAIVAAVARMHGGKPLATSSDCVTAIGLSLRDGESDNPGLSVSGAKSATEPKTP